MTEPDVSKLSDEELLALINAGGQVQPVDANTGEPLNPAQSQTYQQLNAAGGIDPSAPGGSPRLPLAQRRPEDEAPAGQFFVDTEGKVRQQRDPEADYLRQAITRASVPFLGPALAEMQGGGERAFSTSVPVLGAFADEANAAVNAGLAPAVEPMLRGLERMGVSTPYDERYRLDNAGNFGERYAQALSLEKLQNDAARESNPDMAAAGLISGIAASVPYLPSTALGAEAGILSRMGAGAVEGAGLGALQGYGEGAGGFSDKSRVEGAGGGAAIGGALGGAFPLAMKGAGAVWNQTGGRALDAVRARAGGSAAPEVDVEALARLTGGTPGTPRALSISNDRELADILASVTAAPKMPDVAPSALDDAYARIARAAQRQGQTPQQLAEAVQALGPRGVIADSGQSVKDLTRAAMNRPSGAEDIARANLDIRQMGVRDGADFLARPSSTRITDEAVAGIGGGERTYLETFDALNKVQKEAADPLYDQVRQIGATDSDVLRRLQDRPSVKRAVARAYNIAKEEGRNPEDLAIVSVESPENWVRDLPPEDLAMMQAQGAVLKRSPSKAPSQGKSLAKFLADNGGVIDDGGDLAAMGAGEWNKGKAYQRGLIAKPGAGGAGLPGMPKAYQPKGASADDAALRAWEAGYFPQWKDRPTTRELYDALAEELRGKPRYAKDMASELTDRLAKRDQAEEVIYRGGADPAPSPDDYTGSPTPTDELAYEAQPTAETWDLVKRGLDDELAPYFEGKKVWDSQARATLQTLNELRGELVRLNPVYGEALDAYSGPAAMKDALTAGQRAFSETGEALGRKFADFNAGEREMYRLGAIQALREKLGSNDVTFNAAQRAGILKPAQLERFKELFPTDKAVRSFVEVLDREAAMFGTRSDLFRVSTTAKQLANAQEDAPGPVGAAIETAANIKTGGIPAMIRALSNFGAPKMSQETAEAVAAITTNLDQSQLPAAIARMEQNASTQALAEGLKNYMRYGTTTGGASAFAGERR